MNFLIRKVASFVLSCFYRIKKKNFDIPSEGPVVVVGNHVSYLDAIMIAAKSKRPLRFVAYYKIYNMFLLKPFFKAVGAIPIAGRYEDKEVFEKSFDMIDEALKNGEAVFIFPEGKITHDGKINDFKSGVEHIIKRTPAPVYTCALKGLYGSHFSRDKNKKWYGKIWQKIEIIGGSLYQPSDVNRHVLKSSVENLSK